jgi:hypothetical protein
MSKREPGSPVPLVVYLADKVGVLRAGKVGSFIVAWGWYSDQLAVKSPGEVPTIEGFGKFWRTSRATSFREQRLFREAFPAHDTPEVLWQSIKAQVAEKKRNKAAAQLLAVTFDWAGA